MKTDIINQILSNDITINHPTIKGNQYPQKTTKRFNQELTRDSFIKIMHSKEMNNFLNHLQLLNPKLQIDLIRLFSMLLKSCDCNHTKYKAISKDGIGTFLWSEYSRNNLTVPNPLPQYK